MFPSIGGMHCSAEYGVAVIFEIARFGFALGDDLLGYGGGLRRFRGIARIAALAIHLLVYYFSGRGGGSPKWVVGKDNVKRPRSDVTQDWA